MKHIHTVIGQFVRNYEAEIKSLLEGKDISEIKFILPKYCALYAVENMSPKDVSNCNENAESRYRQANSFLATLALGDNLDDENLDYASSVIDRRVAEIDLILAGDKHYLEGRKM